MKPLDIFFVRRFNDLDHIVPVVYRTAKEGRRTSLVLCLNPFMEITDDFRLKFLRESWGVKTQYVYTYYAPTLPHKAVGRWICSSHIRSSVRELFAARAGRASGIRRGLKPFARPGEIALRIAYACFKKYLYAWTDRVLVRRVLFNKRWAEAFLKHTRAATLVFDYVHSNIHVAGALIEAAHELGVPLISVPHGTSIFSGRPLEGPEDNHARVIHSGVDYFVVHHRRDEKVLVDYGFDAKKLKVLGSARYCQEWEGVLHRIVPTEKIPEPRDPGRRLKVVYMERGADRHGAYKRLVWETLERIASLDFVDFIIKPPTRTDRLHFGKLPDSVMVANDINSVNLCRWADVVVGTVTSILLEAFWQRKILLYPKYFHDDSMWFEETGACWTVAGPEELEAALRRLKDDPLYRPYPQSAVDSFIRGVVYAEDADKDVLGRYCRFIAEAAGDGEHDNAFRREEYLVLRESRKREQVESFPPAPSSFAGSSLQHSRRK